MNSNVDDYVSRSDKWSKELTAVRDVLVTSGLSGPPPELAPVAELEQRFQDGAELKRVKNREVCAKEYGGQGLPREMTYPHRTADARARRATLPHFPT